ncbi:TauD/TfdA family dioxygenase [Amycolatopsis sp. A133]|uniref:TauD/TfdA family dioxygenase n=1 Tax=Amycolatopsis sp. A133 TaxID=3064472 RepID=UPI0027ECC633|nr:TauD/TfdA family dioxygenase [Amycolatopsis sp. A133]MDQ7808407.1 TauD/TfdA family dioxygenase [Amycolatopsis sp. A133]
MISLLHRANARRARIMTDSPANGHAILQLTAQDRHQLVALTSALEPHEPRYAEEYCRTARDAVGDLPQRVKRALADFARWSSPSGTLLLRGLPVGDVPGTPSDNTQHIGERTRLARIQAIFGETLGNLVAYEAEGDGRLFQDMVPARAAAHRQTSLGSRAELEVHTEQAFSALRPDFLMLGCIRGDPDARTFTLTARQIARHVDEPVLWKPLWTTGVDESFRLGGHTFLDGDVRGPIPVLHGTPEDPFVVFDQDLMTSTDKAARRAFRSVVEIYQRERRQHVLAAGDLLVIDNRRALHGRSSFSPRFDGSDRFIIRCFVTADLGRSRYARPGDGRTIGARFS